MSTSNVTPNPMDIGLATGPAPTPAAPSAIQPTPNPAAQPTPQPAQVTPQSGAQPNQPAASNAPDADTAAAKSIPAKLVNDPLVPTQEMATQADLNKNSDAPAHSKLYNSTIAMLGGQRYTSTTDSDGNIVRTPIQPKPWALGLALALSVLSGGMAGMGAKTTGEAAKAGAAQVDKQRAAVQQANAQQDAQAKADQDHKLAVTGANLRNYMTSVNAGKSSMAASQAFGDSYKDWAGFSDGTIPLPPGMTKSDPQWETDATAAVKNSKTNITRDFLFPIGDPKPVYGKDGKQVTVNGIPQVGQIQSVDALPRNVVPGHAGAEGQVGQNGQLLRRVAAIDVHRRIGFCIAQPLGLVDRVGIRRAMRFHLRQDVIARAVENGVDRLDFIGREALTDVGDDRNAAGHRGFKGDRAAQFAGPIKQFRPVGGQQRLVRRDDVFSASQQFEHNRAGRPEAADQQRHDRDFLVAGDPLDVIGQDAGRQDDIARFAQIADHDLLEHQLASRMARNPVAVIEQQACDARADRAQPDDGYLRVLHNGFW